MNRHIVCAGLVVVLATVLPKAVLACQLQDVLSEACDADLVIEVPPQGSPRGAVSLDRLWTKYFKNFTKLEEAVLNVCFFRKQAKDSKGETPFFIAELSDKGWEKAVKSVVKNATDWTDLEIEINGNRLGSRLKFNFLDTNGAYRTCEDSPVDQIRIMFNADDAHRSKVGTDSLDYEGWSMTLALRSGRVPRYAVLHEFGHALGFLHEMGHPDWKACAELLEPETLWRKGMFGKDIPKTEELARIKRSVLNAAEGYGKLAATSTYDPQSVMTYEIPKIAFPDRPECALEGFVEELSDEDALLFMQYYGKPD